MAVTSFFALYSALSVIYALGALYVPNAIFSQFLGSAILVLSLSVLYCFPIGLGISYACVLVA